MACSENLRVKVSNGSHGTHVLKKESQAVGEGIFLLHRVKGEKIFLA